MPNNKDPRLFRACCHELQPVEVIHRNPWFQVLNRGGFFTMEYQDGLSEAVVLPVVDNDSIVMVRVKRPVIGDDTWELPSGGINLDQESPAVGIARELREETGIVITDPERFRQLPPIAVSAGRNPRLSFVFHVDITSREFEQRGQHDEEILSVHCLPIDEVCAMILDGRIYVTMALALIGRYLAERRLS
jgi:8-oxo-dGTP pyrophosphatase MutT (NUDIX family)